MEFLIAAHETINATLGSHADLKIVLGMGVVFIIGSFIKY